MTAPITDMIGDVLAFLASHEVKFCAIGGVAVNAYVDPVVTLDLDLVVEDDLLVQIR